MLAAGLVGLIGGLVAYLYATILHFLLHVVWETARPFAAALLDSAGLPGDPLSLIVVTSVGGLIVGLSLKRLGVPGEIAAVVNNIHLENGRIPVRQTPSMIVTSLASIVAGGSAGPEAPLVQIIGSGGSWLGDRIDWLRGHARTLTFCGMAAALGAFFGAPLAGAVFALEIPHRNGLEYYEALLPAICSAFFSFWVFDALGGHPVPIFPLEWTPPSIASEYVLESVLLGAVGAVVAIAFTHLFNLTGKILHRWEKRFVLIGTMGGVLLGLLALLSPSELASSTLFWGEFEIAAILVQLQQTTLDLRWIAPLALLALMKMLAVGITLNTGFRGGFIFPLFFIGGLVGVALSVASQGWFPLPLSVLCLMAATNVGVTRTPVSTTVLLGTLTGVAATPLVLAASLTSFALTARIQLIQTQRPRDPRPDLAWRDQNV